MYKNILVAMDFSDQSVKAFERAIQIAKEHHAKLELVSVVDTRAYVTVESLDPTYATKIKADMEKDLVKYQQKALDAGIAEVSATVEIGSPKKVLINAEGIDLIVIGATGLNLVERKLIGSVSENVVRHAICDVLIVRS